MGIGLLVGQWSICSRLERVSILSSMEEGWHTVNSQVTKGGTCCPLHFQVRVLEEKQYGLESIVVDFANI